VPGKKIAADPLVAKWDAYSTWPAGCAPDQKAIMQAEQDELWTRDDDSPADETVAAHLSQADDGVGEAVCADPESDDSMASRFWETHPEVRKAWVFWETHPEHHHGGDATANPLPEVAAAARVSEMNNDDAGSWTATPGKDQQQQESRKRTMQQQQLESRKKQQQEHLQLLHESVRDVLSIQHHLANLVAKAAGGVCMLSGRALEAERFMASWNHHPYGDHDPAKLHEATCKVAGQIQNGSNSLAAHAAAAHARLQDAAKTAATLETPQTPQETPKP
jgi:hypothetical protein